MESILVNPSSPPQPDSSAASGIATALTDDQGSKKDVKAAAQAVVEIIYDEPEPLLEQQDKHPMADNTTSLNLKSDNSTADNDVCSPDQFNDYTDEELEVLAMALSKTLKQRQGYTGETSAEPKLRNEPRGRYERRAKRLAHARNVHGRPEDLNLDTIVEDNLKSDILVEAAAEAPPPIPEKKRRQYASPSGGDPVPEVKTNDGKKQGPARVQ